MHSKISCTTSTIGKFLPVAGIALYAGISPSSTGIFHSHQSSICVGWAESEPPEQNPANAVIEFPAKSLISCFSKHSRKDFS